MVALERQLLEVALTTLNLSQNIRETEEYKQCVRQLQLSSVGTKFTSLVKQSIEDSLGSSFLNKAKQLASAGKLEQAIKETRWIPDGTQANNDASRLTEEWSNTLREQAEARQRAEARQAVRAERLQLEGRMRATQQERAQLENLIIELKQRIRTSQWKQQYQVQQELESQLKPLIQQLKTLLAEQKNLQQQLYEQIAREKNLEEQLE